MFNSLFSPGSLSGENSLTNSYVSPLRLQGENTLFIFDSLFSPGSLSGENSITIIFHRLGYEVKMNYSSAIVYFHRVA